MSMNQLSAAERTLVRIQINSDEKNIIDAVCVGA
jgi:hypothetical protein